MARTPDSVTSLVAKKPPGPVTSPMFLRRCHIYMNIYRGHRASTHALVVSTRH